MNYATLKDYEEIFAVLKEYAEGCNESGEAAKKCFHENALVNAEPALYLTPILDRENNLW